MREELTQEYGKVEKDYARVYESLVKVTEEAKTSRNLEELADVAFITRELARKFDDLRKESNRLSELSQRKCVACWVLLGERAPEKIQTQLVTTKADIKFAPQLPKKDSPEYAGLMQYFGVPLQSAGLVSFHWPNIAEWISEKLATGQQVPKELQVSETPIHRLTPMRGTGLLKEVEVKVEEPKPVNFLWNSFVKGAVK